MVQCEVLFHFPRSDLGSDWFWLMGSGMRDNFEQNSRVFDCDSVNIGRIAYLKFGGGRAANTAQSTYWTCYNTVRTQIRNCREKSVLAMSGFWGGTQPKCNGPGFHVVKQLQWFGSGSNPNPELIWWVVTVVNSRYVPYADIRTGLIVGTEYNTQTTLEEFPAMVLLSEKPTAVIYAMFIQPFATNVVRTAQIHSWWNMEITMINPTLRNSDHPQANISVGIESSPWLFSLLTLCIKLLHWLLPPL